MKRIKGQALFLRAFSYYNLAGYYQNVPLITDYNTYSTLDGLYGKNNSYDEVLDQVEADLKEAITLLPTRRGRRVGKGPRHKRCRCRLLRSCSHAAPQV